MYEIPVFASEIEDGIADLVKSTASVAYCVKSEKVELSNETIQRLTASIKDSNFLEKALASVNDSDLYFTKSLLVSTNWNKNDDVFHPYEVWLGRHTPVHKPDNLNHDELDIVGHMIEAWVIDDDGNAIADNTALDDLPESFHILNHSVIYKTWTDEKRKKTIADLIQNIEDDEKFVSMECLFRGFDYATIASDGTKNIITRNKDTSFLTKHLKAYKGTGEYNGYKLGRLMRRITFSAKGYVDRPANENQLSNKTDSIIKFSKASEISSFEKKGVYINSEVNTNEMEHKVMAGDNEVTELKNQVKQLQDENKALASLKVKEVNEKHESTIAALNSEIAGLKSETEAAKAKTKTAGDSVVELTKKYDELNKSYESTKAELSTVKLEITKANRINTLVSAKVDAEYAKAKVEQFSFLNDEQFSAVAEMAIAAAKKDNKEGEDDACMAEKKKQEEATAAKKKSDAEEATKKAFQNKQAKAKKGKGDMNDVDEDDATATLEAAQIETETVANAGALEVEDEDASTLRKSIASYISGKYVNRNGNDETETD